MSDDCGTFCHSQEVIVRSEEKTLKIRVEAGLHSDLMPAAFSELSACPDTIRITENSVLLTIPHPVRTAHAARSSGTMIPLPSFRRLKCDSE